VSRTELLKRKLAVPEPVRSAGRRGAERSAALYETLRNQIVSVRSRPDEDVALAWTELLAHPELSWVPPMWRSMSPTTQTSPHAVSAVERNLKVDIVHGPKGRTEVRLMTGPLHDRRVGDGVDPTTPVVSVDPALTVTAPTFEKAVLELRNAVVAEYGYPSHRAQPLHRPARVHGLKLRRSIPSAR